MAELTVTGTRAQIAVEAVWETEALCLAALGTIANLPHDAGGANLVLRGLVQRIKALNGAVLDALQDDAVSDLQLMQVVGVNASTFH